LKWGSEVGQRALPAEKTAPCTAKGRTSQVCAGAYRAKWGGAMRCRLKSQRHALPKE